MKGSTLAVDNNGTTMTNYNDDDIEWDDPLVMTPTTEREF